MTKKISTLLAVTTAFMLPTYPVIAKGNISVTPPLLSESLLPFDKAWQLDFAKEYAHMLLSLPDPIRVTSERVKESLAQHGYHDIDPDAVFYHRFNGAQSSHRTYNGWAHYEHPNESYTLTQAVMLNAFGRYRDSFPGTINVDTGIYTQDASGDAFDERNEVRLLSSTLWDIAYDELDIQRAYSEALTEFWSQNTARYTQLQRDSYAFSAYQQYHHGLLNQAQYQLAIAILSPSQRREVSVYRFDVYGYDSTDILLIEPKDGEGGLLYTPGAQRCLLAIATQIEPIYFGMRVKFSRRRFTNSDYSR